MNAPYTGPLPRHEPTARWGWSGFADSETGVLVGPGLIAASALAAWTPAAAGAAGFTAAVEFAGIPVAVVLGFFIHARGDLAAEFMRQSAQARKWRAWQLILALPGGAAIWALLLLVAYIAAAKGSEEGASGMAARCLAPLAATMVVLAVGMATRLPHLVNRLREVPPSDGERPTNAWRRALAGAVDAFAMAATATVLLVLFLVAGWVRDAQAVGVWWLAVFAVTMAGYGYVAAVLGRSVGMALAGLRLVDAPCQHRLGRRVRCGLRAFVRVALTAVAVAGVWLVLSGKMTARDDPAGVAALVTTCLLIAMGLQHGRGQSIADVISGTVVVRRSDADTPDLMRILGSAPPAGC